MRAAPTRLTPTGITVLVVLGAALLVRLPFLTALASPDEAGLLLVGAQWQPGQSLYGDYWVDRPPLLIGVAGFAGKTGGLLTLRLIGLAAVAVTIVACAGAARRLAGQRAACWAAATAALLTVSPWLGGDRVNAELLATPWIAVGLYAAVRAVETPARWRWALLTGAGATAALLTKQNHADAAVFAVALLIASVVAGRMDGRAAWRSAALAALGAAVVTVIILGVAWIRGTGPGALVDALFVFRVRAGEVLAAQPDVGIHERSHELLTRSLIGGLAVLVLGVVLAPVARRFRTPASIALSLTVVFGCVSIAGGGNWWNHYLVELAAPVSVGTGLIAVRTRLVVPVALAYSTVAALVGVALVAPAVRAPDREVAAGRMISAAAEPDDTIVNLWGRPDLVLESGLSSPYEHLWSLPVRARDPNLVGFTAVLEGPAAPTWLVMRKSQRHRHLDSRRAQRAVDRRYRPVGTVCGLQIWLRQDLTRAAPKRMAVSCKPPSALR